MATLDANRHSAFIVMGVTSCGKSEVGQALAEALGGPFIEGDALHGDANIAKMSAGTPLTDDDRWPWLARIAEAIQHSEKPVAASCSSLRRAYRDALRSGVDNSLFFVHLHASESTLSARMQARTDHFMPVSLLQSQLATLEPLAADEAGVVVDVSVSLAAVIDAALREVRG